MYGRWIKGYFILAILLMSLVSPSMAACPWFIKNELYSAQCGVLKEVPASSGILANDPIGTTVIDPGSITIDPKYGTLSVKADGSFVFYPSIGISTGTYVIFKYRATNGVCEAKYPGIAKIQVVCKPCKCMPRVVDVTLCMPKSIDDVKAKLIAAGAGCPGCTDITPVFDLSQVKLTPGTYPYLVKCANCPAATGHVTIVPECLASAPDITICEGTLKADIDYSAADCSGAGCDMQPRIDHSLVTTDANGFVTGGTYRAICGEGTECESSATGDIIVLQICDVLAPDIEVCEGEVGLAELTAMINAKAGCSGAGCVRSVDTSAVTVENGFVTGGSYKVCCTVTGPDGTKCTSCAIGNIVVIQKCDVLAPDIEICEGEVGLAELTAMINAKAGCSGEGCVRSVDTSAVTVENGIVTGGSYKVCCTVTGPLGTECTSCAIGNIIVIQKCEVAAPDIEVCEGEVDLAELTAMIDEKASCTGAGCAMAVDTSGVTFVNGIVTGGYYTVTCAEGTECESSATGNIIVIQKCEVAAPDIEVCEGEVDLAELTAMIDEKASCTGAGCAMAVDTSGVTFVNGIVTGGSYKVCCTVTGTMNTECTSCAIGNIIVIQKCPVEALDFPICEGQETLETMQGRYPATCDCSGGLLEIDDSTVTVDDDGFVNGGYYTATCTVPGTDCESSAIADIVWDPSCIEPCPCVAVAPPIEVCAGEVTLAELQVMIDEVADCQDDDSGISCDATPVIDKSGVTVSNGFVTGGTYKVTCIPDDCDQVEQNVATGEITTKSCCDCVADAPDLCLKIKQSPYVGAPYSPDEIKAAVIAAGGGCSEDCQMTISNNVDYWNWEKRWEYKVTCTHAGCSDAVATGILDLDWDGDCECCC